MQRDAEKSDRVSKLMTLFDESQQPLRIREIGREIVALGRELQDEVDDDLQFRLDSESKPFLMSTGVVYAHTRRRLVMPSMPRRPTADEAR